jgi:hypothetical protein
VGIICKGLSTCKTSWLFIGVEVFEAYIKVLLMPSGRKHWEKEEKPR